MGDGADIDFWRDCWYGNFPLSENFRRLYDLAVSKVVTVRKMFLLGCMILCLTGSFGYRIRMLGTRSVVCMTC